MTLLALELHKGGLQALCRGIFRSVNRGLRGENSACRQ
jgi:hypothetical protein